MTTAKPTNNPIIVPKKLPFLESICWQTADVYRFTPEEMLSRYERGWRYHNLFNNLEGEELDFLKQLAIRYKSIQNIPSIDSDNSRITMVYPVQQETID